MAKSNIYELITNKVIEHLEKGVCPWHKPWKSIMNGSACAINYKTRKPYSLINQLMLEVGEYITLGELNKMGGKVKKGSHAHYVYGWFKVLKSKEDGSYSNTSDIVITEENEDDYRVLWAFKAYKVFNVLDCEGITPKGIKDEDATEPLFTHENIECAEDVLKKYIEREGKDGFTFHNIISDNAYYSPTQDKVVVPSKNQYKEITEYYSTAFHEVVHSSGAEKRLARKGVCNFDHFGSHQYSQEELVAELGSAMLMGTLGIDCDKTFDNSVAYLQSWLKSFKNDPKMIVSASTQAEKAVEFIMKGKK